MSTRRADGGRGRGGVGACANLATIYTVASHLPNTVGDETVTVVQSPLSSVTETEAA